jgi:hypothetical protein
LFQQNIAFKGIITFSEIAKFKETSLNHPTDFCLTFRMPEGPHKYCSHSNSEVGPARLPQQPTPIARK